VTDQAVNDTRPECSTHYVKCPILVRNVVTDSEGVYSIAETIYSRQIC